MIAEYVWISMPFWQWLSRSRQTSGRRIVGTLGGRAAACLPPPLAQRALQRAFTFASLPSTFLRLVRHDRACHPDSKTTRPNPMRKSRAKTSSLHHFTPAKPRAEQYWDRSMFSVKGLSEACAF